MLLILKYGNIGLVQYFLRWLV